MSAQLFSPITNLKEALLNRLGDEYKAHFFYRNASNWCDVAGFPLAAAYFAAEAESELSHAGKLQKFLNDWNVGYALPAISMAPAFETLQDVIEQAYGIEVTLYKAYNDNVGRAESIDRSAYNLFLEMVQVQYESVAEYRSLLDQLAQFNDNQTSVKIFEAQAFGE